MAQRNATDLIIAGGGLAGGLVAHALKLRRPELRVVLLEGGERLGGNHVWSFFDDDIAPADRDLIAPFVSHRWQGYDVAFPRRRRTIPDHAYNAVTSAQFDAVLRDRLGDGCRTGVAITRVEGTGVTLADGDMLQAEAVLDARGPGDLGALRGGWQKFVGQLLELGGPHGLERPIIMDACVDQSEGYRFVYVLPFAPDRLFVEDTYYSTEASLDVPALRQRIADYAASRGWSVRRVLSEETGVLPVTTGGDFARYWASTGKDVAKAGVRAGLYHAMTGYSLPDAVRLASAIAAAPDLSAPALLDLTRGAAHSQWRRGGFYRLLGRMLFDAAAPAERYRVLEHFYRLDAGVVGRFYAGRTSWIDRARILSGRPPVPVTRALRALLGGHG